MTTANQIAALEKAAIRTVYFVELQYLSGTQYFSSAIGPLTWGGNLWNGLGSIANIDSIQESAAIDTQPLNFTLNIAQPSILASAVGDVAQYRGRPIKLYFCPMDENFRLIDTPELCWRGVMDTVAVGIKGQEGQIILKCETSAYALSRRPALRVNSAQQKLRYPNDTGLDYLVTLIANPQLWLSKRFQEK